MNILLIAPASGHWRRAGRPKFFNGKTFRFSMLSLLTVAAETPPGHSIRLVDEQIEDIPWESNPDLVGITCMTALAPRAYEIADEFRARGVPVILGGMHPAFCPDEALAHADAILHGEAEGVWPEAVAAAERGRLGGVYRASEPFDLARLKPLPRHLMNSPRYGTIWAVQASRGCPHRCSFCSVSAFSGAAQRRRPAGKVIEEISTIPDNFFLFVDDHLTADRDYALELFRGLIPLGKRWVAQSTLAIAEDAEMLPLAARAGCIGIFAGLETFSSANLESVQKSHHCAARYRESVERLHAHGIGIEAGIVFGLDQDGPAVFEDTLKILDDLRIDAIQASIFTPLPGTPLFASMKDRILDRNWAHYDFHHPVFAPRRMSAEDLQAGHDWATREFYSPARIARRLARMAARPSGARCLPFAAALNAAYFGRVFRWKIQGWNPAERLPSPGRAIASAPPRSVLSRT